MNSEKLNSIKILILAAATNINMRMRLTFLRSTLLAALILTSSVCRRSSNTTNTPNANNATNEAPNTTSNGVLKNKKIRICTFNIQNLGLTKLKKPDVIGKLVSILRKYDIVAVQEISDVHNTAGQKFLDFINDGHAVKYNMVLSTRSGLQPENIKDQEQYAFYYNTTTIIDLGLPCLYNDSAYDYFKREPFLGHFQVKGCKFSFVLCTIHTNPKRAVNEIGALDEVVKWARHCYMKEDHYIVLGDFNASCNYAHAAQLDPLPIRKNYYWLIADSVNTNLARDNCAYDRIVITPATKKDYTGVWGVDRCFTSKAISDHWPVWAEFYANRDAL